MDWINNTPRKESSDKVYTSLFLTEDRVWFDTKWGTKSASRRILRGIII